MSRDPHPTALGLLRRALLVAMMFVAATLLISGWAGPLMIREPRWPSPLPVESAQFVPLAQLTLSDLMRVLDHFERHAWTHLAPIVFVELRMRVLLTIGVLGMSCLASTSLRRMPPQRPRWRPGWRGPLVMAASLSVGVLGIWLAYSDIPTYACVLLMLAADGVAIAIAGLMFRQVAEERRNRPPDDSGDAGWPIYRPAPSTILGLTRTDP